MDDVLRPISSLPPIRRDPAELAILIPTLNRAESIRQLAAEIHENTVTSHVIYFIAEEHDVDTLREINGVDAVSVIGDFGSCAAAYNAGFNACREPYAFLGNDDCGFPAEWELPALELIMEGNPIVGVNEGHGRMTCFSMVDTVFIEKESGVFDKPSTLVHPYKSQYVDTELAEYAKARGVWAEAEAGGVIHKHHDFGLADPNHPNYLKAKSTLDEDRRTYEQRRPQWEAHAAT